MINKKTKGDRLEREVKKFLEKEGWLVYKPVRTRFSEKDIFGIGDLLAVKKFRKPLLFQVKSERVSKKEMIKKMKFWKEYNIELIYAIKKKKKSGFFYYFLKNNEIKKEEDPSLIF